MLKIYTFCEVIGSGKVTNPSINSKVLWYGPNNFFKKWLWYGSGNYSARLLYTEHSLRNCTAAQHHDHIVKIYFSQSD